MPQQRLNCKTGLKFKLTIGGDDVRVERGGETHEWKKKNHEEQGWVSGGEEVQVWMESRLWRRTRNTQRQRRYRTMTGSFTV